MRISAVARRIARSCNFIDDTWFTSSSINSRNKTLLELLCPSAQVRVRLAEAGYKTSKALDFSTIESLLFIPKHVQH
jgi:hypothetical protein